MCYYVVFGNEYSVKLPFSKVRKV